MTTASMPIASKPQRRWLQFRLRTLLLFVPIVGLGAGWFARFLDDRGHEDRAVALIEELGGTVWSSDYILGRLHDHRVSRVCQVDFFRGEFLDRSRLAMDISYVETADITDSDLHRLGKALNGTGVARLCLSGTQITDDGVRSLSQLGSLEELMLDGTRITDAGLSHLGGLTNLRSLSLWLTPVTDAGLPHLRGMKNLRTLDLKETNVTSAGISDLRRRLPNLAIRHQGTYRAEPSW